MDSESTKEELASLGENQKEQKARTSEPSLKARFGSFSKDGAPCVKFVLELVSECRDGEGPSATFKHEGRIQKVRSLSKDCSSFEVDWYDHTVQFIWKETHWAETTPEGCEFPFSRTLSRSEELLRSEQLKSAGLLAAAGGDWEAATKAYRKLAENPGKDGKKLRELYFGIRQKAVQSLGITSKSSRVVPTRAALRERLFVPCDKKSESLNQRASTLRIATFNILSQEWCAESGLRHAGAPTPKHLELTGTTQLGGHDFLGWPYRWNLITAELDRCGADILVLQEVSKNHYAAVEKALQQRGYKSWRFLRYLHRKTKGDSEELEGKIRFQHDSVYIAWKKKRFRCVQCAALEHCNLKDNWSHNGVTGVVALQPCNPKKDVGVIFAGGHMYWEKNAETLQLLERELKRWCLKYERFAPVIAMDFNSMASSILPSPHWTSACKVTDEPGDAQEASAYIKANVIQRKPIKDYWDGKSMSPCLKTVGMQGSVVDLETAVATQGSTGKQVDDILFLGDTALQPRRFLQFTGRASAGQPGPDYPSDHQAVCLEFSIDLAKPSVPADFKPGDQRQADGDTLPVKCFFEFNENRQERAQSKHGRGRSGRGSGHANGSRRGRARRRWGRSGCANGHATQSRRGRARQPGRGSGHDLAASFNVI
mmetsp:Transcript_13041/g.20911  ORF Transcript_13041/g.20911 Transcript_13041/m.20911 type:complete len:654 (-) Transcript_13041:62-2023(-)